MDDTFRNTCSTVLVWVGGRVPAVVELKVKGRREHVGDSPEEERKPADRCDVRRSSAIFTYSRTRWGR